MPHSTVNYINYTIYELGVPGPKLHDTLLTAVDTKTEFGDQGIQFTMKNVANTLTRLR